MRLIWLAWASVVLSGCGSAGGGAAGTALQPGVQLVEIGTGAGSAATVLYAAGFTLQLPAGVTLPADPSSGEVAAGVLQPADATALAGARYLPAADGAPAQLSVTIADPLGFAVGALATLSCSVAPGASLGASGFSLAGFSARDSNGAVIPGVTAHLTLRTQ